MRIYIAFANPDERLAQSLATSLTSDGHTVLHPTQSVTAQGPARALARSDFMVFLVSPDSIAPGCQYLSDLLLFQKRWRTAHQRIAPVKVRPVDGQELPRAISELGLEEVRGNLAADVSNAIARRRAPAVRLRKVSVATALAAATGGVALFWLNRPVTTKTIEPPQFIVTNADQFTYWGSRPKYGLKLDKPGSTSSYTCELGAVTGSNLVGATSQPASGKAPCDEIEVQTAPGPFEGVTENGFQSGGTVPYVIKGPDGSVLTKGAIDVIMSNSSVKLRISGLERASNTGWGGYFVSSSATYDVAVVNDGAALPAPYVCAVSASGSVVPSGNGCKFKLSGARPGQIEVTVTGVKASPQLFAGFGLVAK